MTIKLLVCAMIGVLLGCGVTGDNQTLSPTDGQIPTEDAALPSGVISSEEALSIALTDAERLGRYPPMAHSEPVLIAERDYWGTQGSSPGDHRLIWVVYFRYPHASSFPLPSAGGLPIPDDQNRMARYDWPKWKYLAVRMDTSGDIHGRGLREYESPEYPTTIALPTPEFLHKTQGLLNWTFRGYIDVMEQLLVDALDDDRISQHEREILCSVVPMWRAFMERAVNAPRDDFPGLPNYHWATEAIADLGCGAESLTLIETRDVAVSHMDELGESFVGCTWWEHEHDTVSPSITMHRGIFVLSELRTGFEKYDVMELHVDPIDGAVVLVDYINSNREKLPYVYHPGRDCGKDE